MRELSKKAIKFLSHQDHFHRVEILIEIKIGAFHAKLQQRHIFGFLFSTVEEGKVICFWHLVYLVAISNRLKTEIYKVPGGGFTFEEYIRHPGERTISKNKSGNQGDKG